MLPAVVVPLPVPVQSNAADTQKHVGRRIGSNSLLSYSYVQYILQVGALLVYKDRWEGTFKYMATAA